MQIKCSKNSKKTPRQKTLEGFTVRKAIEFRVIIRSGKISDERFMILTKSYEKEQRELNEILEALDEQLADIEIQNLNSYQFTLLIKRYTEITELTAPLLKELVDKIVIHQSEMRNGQRTQEIDIYYRFIGTI